jgi:predicted  nucleic acid-binding Zn-ribbon protein
MEFESFTKEQIISALKSVRIENADLLNTISKLKKELKELKGQMSHFEADRLDRRTVARRSTIH